jgi:phosphatidylglycerophosphatase A
VSSPTPAGRSAGESVRAPLWTRAIATCGALGYLRPAPGTWTSAVTLLVWWLLATLMPYEWQIAVAIAAAVVLILLGTPAATAMVRETGDHDPSRVVVDEAAGQLIAVIAAPLSWKTIFAGFILFRVFDILKPTPLRRLEKIPNGLGVILDDVGAGVYSLIVLQVALRAGWLS